MNFPLPCLKFCLQRFLERDLSRHLKADHTNVVQHTKGYLQLQS